MEPGETPPSDSPPKFSFRNPFRDSREVEIPPFWNEDGSLNPMGGTSVDFSKVKYLARSRHDGPTRPPFVDPPPRYPSLNDERRRRPVDKINFGDQLWTLYRTDRVRFVQFLVMIDGPEWPKHMVTQLGQSYRIEDDGFMWPTSG